ncbi:hypothetical protein [Methylacidimicrobium sp. B4]|uniref:hypothetical protein n=1 Tax=Methylacidimicrobium sp. B4 TaxID=2796139 RepID=UPI001A908B65|nr:hypothetical protein [Methylacidimicrobium sp. B4]QSR83818.1 hypothetical protein MacB4_05875 [Methylacidimicrobium sp. B4]
MERILDLLSLTASTLIELGQRAPVTFLVLLGFASLSAALSWLLLTHSVLLWNKRFAARAQRHPLCALAALATLFAVPLLFGASLIQPFVHRSIREEAGKALADPRWQESAFDQAWGTILRRRLEPLLPPREAHCLVLTTAAAREAAAGAYSAAAVARFSEASRVPGSLLGLSAAATAEALSADMQSFFDFSPGLYPEARIEQVIVTSWSATANRRSREAARQVQSLAALLLLLPHLAAFGVVGWSGYREIGSGHRAGNR